MVKLNIRKKNIHFLKNSNFNVHKIKWFTGLTYSAHRLLSKTTVLAKTSFFEGGLKYKVFYSNYTSIKYCIIAFLFTLHILK